MAISIRLFTHYIQLLADRDIVQHQVPDRFDIVEDPLPAMREGYGAVLLSQLRLLRLEAVCNSP